MNRCYSLDRLEEACAVLVDQSGTEITVPRELMATAAKEGMLVQFDEMAGLYCPERKKTDARQQQMKSRVSALLNRQKGE